MSMIYVESLTDLAEICARLCHEGIIFEAGIRPNGMWRIELRGF